MHHFHYRDGRLHCEDVPLDTIADQVGTPCYVYSTATLTRHYNVLADAFDGSKYLIAYSVKACGNIGVAKTLAGLGAGAEEHRAWVGLCHNRHRRQPRRGEPRLDAELPGLRFMSKPECIWAFVQRIEQSNNLINGKMKPGVQNKVSMIGAQQQLQIILNRKYQQ